MKKMKAIIIDDEPLAHKVILKYAADLHQLEIIGQYHLATEAYEILHKSPIDLIFLDIQMPKLKGLDFLRTLDPSPHVILTTAYEEYALESYELQVTDYLLKPFRFDRFVQAVEKVRSSLEAVGNLQDKNSIFVKVDKRKVQVELEDLYYLESYGNYVKVWQEHEFLLTARTLSAFDAELPDNFLRVHKSFIVNRNKIKFLEGNQIVLKNGSKVLVGKNYRAMMRALF